LLAKYRVTTGAVALSRRQAARARSSC
jgi:hypothetical protein